jgi:hypothetical protein
MNNILTYNVYYFKKVVIIYLFTLTLLCINQYFQEYKVQFNELIFIPFYKVYFNCKFQSYFSYKK